MRTRILTLALALLAPTPAHPGAAESSWRRAEPGWDYRFPRDHRPHPEFQTEWWYFTGIVRDAQSTGQYGYQLVFFRQGIRPPGSPPAQSRFVIDHLKFAHFAVSDPEGRRFFHTQRAARGAFGEAGFGPERLAWIDPWEVRLTEEGSFHLRAAEGDHAIDLTLRALKPPVIHGVDGVSRKGAKPGQASHYVSLTRLDTAGTLTVRGRTLAVAGESWFDQEWATNQLAPDQAGWDWFSLRLDDGSDLMLYRMRRTDGSTDPASSGTHVNPSGATRHLSSDEIQFVPIKTWKSPATGAVYPVEWRVRVAPLGIYLEVRARFESQELTSEPIRYWEGMVRAEGNRYGAPLKGAGYLEMAGYADPLTPLQQP